MEQKLKLSSYFYKGIRINYRLGTEDEKVLNHSFEKDIFFKEIPSFIPSRAPVIIDVGAHIGTFSLLASLKFPEATIYAYEASRESFRVLLENKESNKLDRLKVFHGAISSLSGTVKLFHNEKTGNWGHSITKPLSKSFEEVNSATLMNVIDEHAINFIDLIKFNCEGAEFEILFTTPPRMLKKIGVGIILYHEDLDSKFGSAEKLSALFKGMNFRVDKINKGSHRGWLIVWNRRKYSRMHFVAKAISRRLKG